MDKSSLAFVLQGGKSPFSTSEQQEDRGHRGSQEQKGSKKRRKKRKSKEGDDSRESSSNSSGEEAPDQQKSAPSPSQRLGNVSMGTDDEEIILSELSDIQSKRSSSEAPNNSVLGEEQVGASLLLSLALQACGSRNPTAF